MNQHETLTIHCTYCGNENRVSTQRIRDLVLCTHCNDVLFELDFSLKDIRLTKRFGELYRILTHQLGEIRKMLVQFDKEHKIQYCGDAADFGKIDSETIIPEKNLSGTIEILEKLLNENQICDNDTRKSIEDLCILLKNYIQNTEEFCKMFDGTKSAASLRDSYTNLRNLEKEVNAFIRMMTSYLGEAALAGNGL